MTIKYNTNRTLESFNESLNIIKEHGFNPIAVAQMYFEDTFVFETEEEANKAHSKLENIEKSKVVGWWYGKKEFLETVKEYENQEESSKVLIYWLKK